MASSSGCDNELKFSTEATTVNPQTTFLVADVSVFIIVLKDNIPVACEHLRPHKSPHAVEIKRRYTMRKPTASWVSDFFAEFEKAVLLQGWPKVKFKAGPDTVFARRFYYK